MLLAKISGVNVFGGLLLHPSYLSIAAMMNRYSMDRFKKAESAEPFSVNSRAVVQAAAGLAQARPSLLPVTQVHSQPQGPSPTEAAAQAACFGGGQSNWQPPDWAVEPRAGVYWLDVLKDGEVVGNLALEKRRNIFGRQAIMCDFVLEHPSVSRQHAAVVQHKNGSIYVIDLGSVHGTFVANERLSKDNPVELEIGQSLRFAASTRSYVLRKRAPPVPQYVQPPVDFILPPPPDPSNEEAVVAYNTILNRLGIPGPNLAVSGHSSKSFSQNNLRDAMDGRQAKKVRKSKVTFRDQYDGILVEVVGISDGFDVSTEPGPVGVKEGFLVGKFDDLVEVTVIPKGKDDTKTISQNNIPTGVTQKLQQCLEKVKSPGKGGLYGGLYGDSFAVQVGASWAKSSSGNTNGIFLVPSDAEREKVVNGSAENTSGRNLKNELDFKVAGSSGDTVFDEDDDLFGDAVERNGAT